MSELNDLLVFFESNKGLQVLKFIRLSSMAELIIDNGGQVNLTAQDKAEYDKFAATPLGKKFISAYLNDTIAYQQTKENEVRNKIPNAAGFAILEIANLNKFFNQFVAEN